MEEEPEMHRLKFSISLKIEGAYKALMNVCDDDKYNVCFLPYCRIVKIKGKFNENPERN